MGFPVTLVLFEEIAEPPFVIDGEEEEEEDEEEEEEERDDDEEWSVDLNSFWRD